MRLKKQARTKWKWIKYKAILSFINRNFWLVLFAQRTCMKCDTRAALKKGSMRTLRCCEETPDCINHLMCWLTEGLDLLQHLLHHHLQRFSTSAGAKLLDPLLVLLQVGGWHRLGDLPERRLKVLHGGGHVHLVPRDVADLLRRQALDPAAHGHEGGVSAAGDQSVNLHSQASRSEDAISRKYWCDTRGWARPSGLMLDENQSWKQHRCCVINNVLNNHNIAYS